MIWRQTVLTFLSAYLQRRVMGGSAAVPVGVWMWAEGRVKNEHFRNNISLKATSVVNVKCLCLLES